MIFQTPVPEKPQADQTAKLEIRRELKNKQTHRIRVHLEYERADEPVVADYQIVAITKVDGQTPDIAELGLTFKDYELHAEGRIIKKPMIGSGKISISTTGLPTALVESLTDDHFWYPMLALYLPAKVENGEFPIEEALGGSMAFVGKGRLDDSTFDVAGSLNKGTKPVGKILIKWLVDRKGWLTRGKGEVTDEDGTLKFSINGG